MDTTAAKRTHATGRMLPFFVMLATCFLTVAGAQQRRGGVAGRWDMTVHDAAGDYPSWMEVNTTGAAVNVTFVGRIGHARHLASASLTHGVLQFTVPADGLADGTQQYRAVLRGRKLVGELSQAGHPDRSWIGKAAPSLSSSTQPHWGPQRALFDGNTLAGWHLSSTSGHNWAAHKGELTTAGQGADLISDAKYGDFQLHLEWRCSPGTNSGVYLRGRYEVQIETDSAAEPSNHHTGGVYGFLTPQPEQPRVADTWQSFDLTLIGRTVTVVQNGVTVVDHNIIPGITGGALDSDEGAPGPVVLQGGETGTTSFRNLIIRTAKTRPPHSIGGVDRSRAGRRASE